MRKLMGVLVFSAGAIFLVAALFTSLLKYYEGQQGGKSAEALLKEVQYHINTEGAAAQTAAETRCGTVRQAFEVDAGAAQVAIGKQEDTEQVAYMGILSMPDLGLVLPVLAEWDYEKLKWAPCCQSGSIEEKNLVIAAHNYSTHFGKLKKLEAGSLIYMTDISGNEYGYEVAAIAVLGADEVEAVLNGGYPLTLYTCTTDGKERIVVFCTSVGA